MPGIHEVLGGVPIRRLVTAADLATFEAFTKMDPPTSDLQTLLAAHPGPHHVVDLDVSAVFARRAEVDILGAHDVSGIIPKTVAGETCGLRAASFRPPAYSG